MFSSYAHRIESWSYHVTARQASMTNLSSQGLAGGPLDSRHTNVAGTVIFDPAVKGESGDVVPWIMSRSAVVAICPISRIG